MDEAVPEEIRRTQEYQRLAELDTALNGAINRAHNQGVPDAAVVALLQAHLFKETRRMIGDK